MSAEGLAVSARVAQRDFAVSVSVAPGEVLAVLGPNGAGKSTLLQVIAGLLAPDEGWVRWAGRALTDTAAGIALAPHRRRISLLAQEPLLFPHLSVLDNVAFGPRSRGMSVHAAAAVARDWLLAVDAVELAQRRPNQLSGGQAQRVALARAAAVAPDVLLLDEPMAALDISAAAAMRTLLRRVLGRDEWGRDNARETSARTSVLLVTHDIVDALTLADRIAVLENGRVVEEGPVAAVLTEPHSAFAAQIAGVNLIVGTATQPDAPDTAAGAVRCGDQIVRGRCAGGWQPGAPAAAVFSPGAVAVYLQAPKGSPRNVFAVVVAELTDRGGIVRVRARDTAGGMPGLCADLTAAAASELGVTAGMPAYFVVKATEVRVYLC